MIAGFVGFVIGVLVGALVVFGLLVRHMDRDDGRRR